MKKNKDKRLELRISSEEYLILQYLACRSNMTMANYIRSTVKKISLPIVQKIQKGELTYDNLEAYINHKLQYKEFFRSSAARNVRE